MALRRIGAYSALVYLLLQSTAWAVPDNTLSITPSATAGTTITAADENDRNSDVVTTYNAHGHTDISQVGNNLAVGDGTAGTKSVCANAADGTDRCIRYNDTADLFQADVPVAGTYNQLLVSTGTTGLVSGGLIIGSNNNVLEALPVLANGQLLIGDGSGEPAIRFLTPGAGIDITNAAGSITIAGVDGAERTQRTAGNVTTTSTSLVDLTGASLSITTGTNPILVGWVGSCYGDTGNMKVRLNVDIDGTDELGAVGLLFNVDVTSNDSNCSFTILSRDLSAGSHTVKLQWSVTAGTGGITATTDNPYTFWVQEVTD